jgi:peptide/nickel transport system permease protein
VRAYLIKRTASVVITLLGVSILAFCTTALVPGNAATVLLGTYASSERLAEITHQMGLDRPLWVRYAVWLREALSGNLGASTLSTDPVTSLLAHALPVTLELTIFAVTLAVLFAVPVGLILGRDSTSWWARPVMFVVTLGISIPGYLVGLVLIIIFSVKLGFLPAGGYVPFSDDPVENLKLFVLPSVTLSLYLAPPLVRFLRTQVLVVLREDFVGAARAKGISESRVMVRHIAPNALIPTLTFFGLQLGFLLSGAIVTEVIFGLPGMGRLALTAILDHDYPVVQGVVLVGATGYVVINLLVDLAYGFIDPRVRTR